MTTKKRIPRLSTTGTEAQRRAFARARLTEVDFEQRLAEMRRAPLLSNDDERRLGRLARAGDPSARDQLVESNLRLVVIIAAEYHPQRLTLLDLVQEGALGLLRAVEKYDPDRFIDARFATYAGWWIRREIQLAIAKRDRVIDVPVYAQVGKRRRRDVTPDALSLDMPAVADGINETTLGELIADETREPLETRAERQEQAAVLYQAIRQLLSTRERQVLSLRFGLVPGDYGTTLREVAARLGFTYQRAQQLEASALAKLRAGLTRDADGGLRLLGGDEMAAAEPPPTARPEHIEQIRLFGADEVA